MSQPRRRLRDSEQEVTFDFAPMVDIVLLLLIFFFLTSNLGARQNVMPLDLPRASSTVQATPDIPIVTVDQKGKLFLNGYETNLEQLKTKLTTMVKSSGGLVGVRADERGNYGTVVRVMDVIKQAGGERLALGTRAAP
ncbi:MAG: biopolymer transporter ExbD [Deinococcus sp.]|uniref:ExbD/TolR family protein n=1 Tax=Deinococcus sp. TaxID=47478 RepID=UPI0026DD61CC|nr:biopolymer transporter ExbD [Deinococcus sp.]MDO4246526.1 biopolymer transporter ExbD [Deinococcus sp.]